MLRPGCSSPGRHALDYPVQVHLLSTSLSSGTAMIESLAACLPTRMLQSGLFWDPDAPILGAACSAYPPEAAPLVPSFPFWAPFVVPPSSLFFAFCWSCCPSLLFIPLFVCLHSLPLCPSVVPLLVCPPHAVCLLSLSFWCCSRHSLRPCTHFSMFWGTNTSRLYPSFAFSPASFLRFLLCIILVYPFMLLLPMHVLYFVPEHAPYLGNANYLPLTTQTWALCRLLCELLLCLCYVVWVTMLYAGPRRPAGGWTWPWRPTSPATSRSTSP